MDALGVRDPQLHASASSSRTLLPNEKSCLSVSITSDGAKHISTRYNKSKKSLPKKSSRAKKNRRRLNEQNARARLLELYKTMEQLKVEAKALREFKRLLKIEKLELAVLINNELDELLEDSDSDDDGSEERENFDLDVFVSIEWGEMFQEERKE